MLGKTLGRCRRQNVWVTFSLTLTLTQTPTRDLHEILPRDENTTPLYAYVVTDENLTPQAKTEVRLKYVRIGYINYVVLSATGIEGTP